MIKLIITDLDGTFLNSQGDYNREYYADIHRLMSEQQIHFAVCTGKQCDRVEELFNHHRHQIWIVGDSATSIKFNGQYIYRSFIKNAYGQKIIHTLEQISDQHVIIACTADGAIIKKTLPNELKNKVRGSYSNIIEVDKLSAITADFLKITVYDKSGHCPHTRQHLTPYENDVYIVVSEDAWIDITEKGVHKGSTIQKLQAILDVDPYETMAFGDGYNDIELLEQAEYSFAMGNAFNATKAAANFVIGSNDENAVLHTIKRILALQS